METRATEIVVSVTFDTPWESKPCTHCSRELAVGDTAVICPRCKSVHHVACWKERGGCARFGCRQLAVTVLPDPPKHEDRLEAPKPAWLRTPVVLAIAMVVLLAAVGVFTARERQEATPAAAVPQLRVMSWGTPEEYEKLKKIAASFQQAHGAKVQVELTPVPAYEQKLLILIAARDVPDLFVLPADRVPLYAERGALLQLDSYFERGELRNARAALPPDRKRQGIVREKRFGVPSPAGAGVMAIWSQTKHPQLAVAFLAELLRQMPPPAKEPPLPDKAFGPLAPGF